MVECRLKSFRRRLGGNPHQMDELNHHLTTTTLRLAAVVERL